MRFGLMFSHQVPPGSGRSWHAPYREMLDDLPRAEELGYSSCLQVSHHVQRDGLCPSPLVALAAATRTMRIGTGIPLVPGANSAQGERELRNDAGNLVTDEHDVDFEHFKGCYIIGDPEFATAELKRYQEELGVTEFVCWMHLPGLAPGAARASPELFAREVMPAFGVDA